MEQIEIGDHINVYRNNGRNPEGPYIVESFNAIKFTPIHSKYPEYAIKVNDKYQILNEDLYEKAVIYDKNMNKKLNIEDLHVDDEVAIVFLELSYDIDEDCDQGSDGISRQGYYEIQSTDLICCIDPYKRSDSQNYRVYFRLSSINIDYNGDDMELKLDTHSDPYSGNYPTKIIISQKPQYNIEFIESLNQDTISLLKEISKRKTSENKLEYLKDGEKREIKSILIHVRNPPFNDEKRSCNGQIVSVCYDIKYNYLDYSIDPIYMEDNNISCGKTLYKIISAQNMFNIMVKGKLIYYYHDYVYFLDGDKEYQSDAPARIYKKDMTYESSRWCVARTSICYLTIEEIDKYIEFVELIKEYS